MQLQKVKEWYRGRHVPPPPPDPGSRVMFLDLGHYEQPAAAKLLGVVGRFWTPDGGIQRIAADEFVTFAEPGFAKAVFNFHAREVAGGTVLTTETRIQGTDERARRTFLRYWRVVMPGSAAIRRAWLRAIRKRAERS